MLVVKYVVDGEVVVLKNHQQKDMKYHSVTPDIITTAKSE